MKGVKRVSRQSFWVWGAMCVVLPMMFLVGCPGPTPVNDEPGLPDKVEITLPQDKAVFNIEADTDKNSPGVQISIEIKVTADKTGKLPKDLKGRILVNNKVAKEVLVTATTLKFDGVTLEEGINSIQAVVEFGGKTQNSNAIQVTADSRCYQIRFALPKDAQVFGNNDDADPQKSGFQTDVEVQVDATALEAIELEITDKGGQATKLSAKPFGGKATFSKVTLPAGEVTLTARITDPAGNKCSDKVTVQVKTTAPTVTLVTPTANQQFCPKDDADTNTSGFQVAVSATTTAGDGSTATLWVNGKQEGQEAVVAGGKVAFTLLLPDQFSVSSEIQVKVKDKLGNEGASTPSKFTAILRGYNVFFAGLIEGQSLDQTRDEDKTKPGLQLEVQMRTSAPDGSSVTLTVEGQPAVPVKVANGVAKTTVTLKEGKNCLSVSATEPKCSTQSSNKVCVTVKEFGVPTLSCVLEKGDPFVAGVSNINKSHDTDTKKAGIQNGIQCKTDAEKDQNLEFTFNGNSQLVKLVDGPAKLRVGNVTGLDFLEGKNSISLKVTNLAGKSTSLSLTVYLDTTPPAAITDLGGSVVDHRKASIKLTWTAPKDSGTNGSGVAKYDIRWSSILSTITEADWEKPEGKQSISSKIAAGQQVTATLDKMSVGKSYVIAVRVRDAAGNLSSISNLFKISVDFKSTSSSEKGTSKTSYGFGIAAVGDLDKDGRQDVVVCAPAFQAGAKSRAGAAFIYYGRDVSLGSFFGTTPDVTITGDNASDSFCQGVEALGDLNGDGFADFAVRSFAAEGRKGRVYIFFGGSRGTSLKNGSASALARVLITGSSSRMLFAASIVAVGVNGAPDINGDKKADLLVSALQKKNGSFLGSVYVFYSRATYPLPGKASLKLEIKDADLEIANDTEASVSGRSFFGITMATGDINGDKKADVLISAAFSNTIVGLYGPIKATSGKVLSLSKFKTKFTLKGSAKENKTFGSSMAVVGDVNKDGTNDIVISSRSVDVGTVPKAGLSRLFSGKTLVSGNTIKDTAAVLSWQGKATFLEKVTAAGDINRDGFADFAIGEGAATDPKNTSNSRAGAVYLFLGRAFNMMKSGDPAKVADVVWYGSQTKAGLGWYGLVGGLDLTGDGFVDLLMAETPPSTESIGGKIILKY